MNPDYYKHAGRDRTNETIPPGHDGDPKVEAKAKQAKQGKPASNLLSALYRGARATVRPRARARTAPDR